MICRSLTCTTKSRASIYTALNSSLTFPISAFLAADLVLIIFKILPILDEMFQRPLVYFSQAKVQLTVIFDWNYGILDDPKGNKSIFFCSDTSYKTKFLTPVTSNTDESHGQGGFGTVKYIPLSGVSLHYVLQSKIILRQDMCNHFRHKCTKLHSKSTKG